MLRAAQDAVQGLGRDGGAEGVHTYGVGIGAKNDCRCLTQARRSQRWISYGLVMQCLLWRGQRRCFQQCPGFSRMLSLTLREGVRLLDPGRGAQSPVRA